MNATRSANRTGPKIRIGGIEGGAKLSGGVQLSKGDLLKLAGAGAAFTTILTGCGPNGAVSTTEAAPPTDKVPTTVPPTAIPTVEGPVNLDVTPTPNIEQSIPSPFEQAGLAYGSYGVDDAGKPVITGGITSSDFEQSNPGTKYTIFGDENGTNVVNTLYPTSNPEITAATMLDQTTLDKLFKAETGKNGITTGVLPDGTEVTKNGTSWVDSEGNILITIVPSKQGKQFGYPLLAIDAEGKLFIGITDANGALVEGEEFRHAFRSPSEVASDVGFENAENVKKVSLSETGILFMYDAEGNWLGEVGFVGSETTFKERLSSATYNNETYNTAILNYASADGLEQSSIKLNIEIKSIEGEPYAFQVDKNGTPLFILIHKDGVAHWEPVTLKLLVDIPGGLEVVGSEPRVFPGFYSQVNQATSGLYWYVIEPKQGTLDLSNFENEVKEMKRNGLDVRGHGLVFPTSNPEWLNNGNYTKEELKQIMEDHITRIITHGKELGISEWIVVNEPYLPIYREGDIFYETYGNYDYIIDAFIAARKADPEAFLIYNDTDNHSRNGLTTQLTQQMVEKLKDITVIGEDGVERPVLNAVGVQAHLGDWIQFPNSSDVTSTLKSYGLPVVVTEFDVNMVNVGGTPEEIAQKQAEVYGEFVRAAIAAGVNDITFWGLTDASNWLKDTGGEGNADLFDANFKPKAAYYEVLRAIYESISK